MPEDAPKTESKQVYVVNDDEGCFGCLVWLFLLALFVLGFPLAAAMSLAANNSWFWACIHFVCSWFYIVYWVFFNSSFVDWLRTFM